MHLWKCVDEAAKFTVGHAWAEGQQVGNIDGSRVMELLQEQWVSVSGRMHALRTDQEGAWRNKEVHERLSDMEIVLDLHPGEAPWQASVTENTIRIVKDTMTRIALERPDLKSTEVLAPAVLAHDEMERVRGFSPAQWTCTELGSIILRQRQRNARSELSGTSARGGKSQRRVAESKRRTAEESISGKKQTPCTFQTW